MRPNIFPESLSAKPTVSRNRATFSDCTNAKQTFALSTTQSDILSAHRQDEAQHLLPGQWVAEAH